MKKLRLNFHLLQPHVVPFTRLHANTNSEKAKGRGLSPISGAF
jgi:hypothetical protein